MARASMPPHPIPVLRRLAADEAALWARVMAQVRPLHQARAVLPPFASSAVDKPVPEVPFDRGRSPPLPLEANGAWFDLIESGRRSTPSVVPETGSRPRPTRAGEGASSTASRTPRTPSDTLDGTWDRRLARGIVAPDRTVDLHGHTLASAHALLDRALDEALRGDLRVLLLVTGKPPRPTSERPHSRGAIRAAVGDWLAGSRFADRIAAVRAAHPRHGGAGALYIVLRKARTLQKP